MKKKNDHFRVIRDRLRMKKNWKPVYLCFFFIWAFTFSAGAVSRLQNVRVSLKLDKVSVKDFFQEIQKQTDLKFVFNTEQTKKLEPVSIHVQSETLETVLQQILGSAGLTYEYDGDLIIVCPVEVRSQQQEVEEVRIEGTVVDKSGSPLPGVTILLKGTQLGTATDANGHYVLTLPKNKQIVLVYSFIGMETKEVKYTGKNFIHVTMEYSKEELEEVVVTGYSKLKKESFTGNATVVDREQLLKTNNKNVFAALQTFDPSFRLKENNIWGSDPNSLPEFNIRGNGSIAMQKSLDVEQARRQQRTALQDNPNLPIFILDGFEVSIQKIYDMDMNRIESMTILKDAAATAMYGSRAANGVVVVTTIAPKPGEIRVTYNFTGGAEFPDLSDYNLCNPEEKLFVEKLAGLYEDPSAGVQAELERKYNDLLNEIRRGVKTDWLALPLRNVFNHSHSFNFSGGVESIRYGVDINYGTHNGAMKGSYRDNMGIALMLDYRLKEWLQVQNQVSYNVTKSEDSPYGTFSLYASLQPYDPVYDDEGELLPTLKYSGTTPKETNPLWKVAYLNSYSGRTVLNDLTNNLSVNLFLFDGFSLKGQFSVTKTDSEAWTFSDPRDPIYRSRPNKEKGSLSLYRTDNIAWNLNAMAYYNKAIARHFVNATLGVNMQNKRDKNSNTNYQGFQLGTMDKPAYAASQPNKTVISNSESRLIGILGSINYSYDNIYLLDGSFRVDGSSQFGSNNRFAPFWSVGVGLNIHNYEFMKDWGVFSTLRIRGSYGTTGNVNFPAYSAISSYETSMDSWYYSTPANTLIYLGNPDLTWEKTHTLDVGGTIGLFQDQLYVEANYYRKETRDLIDEVSIRTSSGFEKYYSNAGSLLNRGFELKVNATVFRNASWTVALNGTLASNKNEILELGDDMEAYNKKLQEHYETLGGEYADLKYIPLTQYYVGASTTAIYGVPSYGIDPSNGQEKFRKKNGRSTYIWNAEDQVVLGDTSPSAQGSFGVNVGFKGFYVNLNFLYQWGAQTYNETLLNKVEAANIAGSNVDRRVLTERWQKPGDVTQFYDIRKNIKTQPTSRFVQDNNYLSFSGMSAGYDFPAHVLSKYRLSSLGIRFNANDICRWASVKEERGTSYPYAKNYSFTLSLGF